MTNIAYQGPLLDYSGYGEASRHAVAALDAAGVGISAQLVSYAAERADFGDMGVLVERLLKNTQGYKIKILHTTPDEFKRLIEPDKYHIAHFFWETDLIPKVYAEGLKLVDEIWTGSKANADAIKAGGVDTPIFIYPQAIQTERDFPAPYKIPEFDGYLFYSIFEWTDRKNPDALLRAYFEEFRKGENVGLLLKTYFRNFTLGNKRMIRNRISMIKAQVTDVKNAPPVFLYLDLMDRQQMVRLHMTGDCYVSAHRGEGWGVPQVEAALCGKPIISTNYSGVHEYFTDGKTAMLLPYDMVPLKGMEHAQNIYGPDQRWADVDPKALRAAMRRAFTDRVAVDKIAVAGQKFVRSRFNLKRVGTEMADRLKEIEAVL